MDVVEGFPIVYMMYLCIDSYHILYETLFPFVSSSPESGSPSLPEAVTVGGASGGGSGSDGKDGDRRSLQLSSVSSSLSASNGMEDMCVHVHVHVCIHVIPYSRKY